MQKTTRLGLANWNRMAVVLVATGCLLLALVAMAPRAHAAPSRSGHGVTPQVYECQITHWVAFRSNEKDANGYRAIAYAEGRYDNYTGSFCGGVRGHLHVWIPAYHVGGATSIRLVDGGSSWSASGSASNAGSSGYWYNLYTSTTYSVACGYAYGSFTPSGGSSLTPITTAGCA